MTNATRSPPEPLRDSWPLLYGRNRCRYIFLINHGRYSKNAPCPSKMDHYDLSFQLFASSYLGHPALLFSLAKHNWVPRLNVTRFPEAKVRTPHARFVIIVPSHHWVRGKTQRQVDGARTVLNETRWSTRDSWDHLPSHQDERPPNTSVRQRRQWCHGKQSAATLAWDTPEQLPSGRVIT